MKKIMILGASILQLPAIKKAKELGLYVIAVDMDCNAEGFAYADLPLVISTLDTVNVLKAAKEHHIDGIMTIASDRPMNTVAFVAEKLGLISVSIDTALKATNKFEMRKALQDFGVPIPQFIKVSDINEFWTALRKMPPPVILKPVDNSGSRGILKLDNYDDLSAVETAYNYSCGFSKNGDVLVEEFMIGNEVSVETLSVEGECNIIQITDKVTTGAPHFVETGHSQPTRYDAATVEKIKKITVAANKAIGITNGPSHTEIMITSEGPKIVELGARLGGDCITTHLVPLSTGVDMVESCIKIALGESPDIERKYAKASAIRFLESEAGTISSIQGVDEAMSVHGVSQVSLVRKVGDTVGNINCSNDRIGFIIAQEECVDLAIKACNEAKEKIKISIV